MYKMAMLSRCVEVKDDTWSNVATQSQTLGFPSCPSGRAMWQLKRETPMHAVFCKRKNSCYIDARSFSVGQGLCTHITPNSFGYVTKASRHENMFSFVRLCARYELTSD